MRRLLWLVLLVPGLAWGICTATCPCTDCFEVPLGDISLHSVGWTFSSCTDTGNFLTFCNPGSGFRSTEMYLGLFSHIDVDQADAGCVCSNNVLYAIRFLEIRLRFKNLGTDAATVTSFDVFADREFNPWLGVEVPGSDQVDVTVYGFFAESPIPGNSCGINPDVPIERYVVPIYFRLDDGDCQVDPSLCDAKIEVTPRGANIFEGSWGSVHGCAWQVVATPKPTATPSNTPIVFVTPPPTKTPPPTSTPTPGDTPTQTSSKTPSSTGTVTPSRTPSETKTPGYEIVPTPDTGEGEFTYELCARGYLARRDTQDEVGLSNTGIGVSVGIEYVNFVWFYVPPEAAIADDLVRIRTADFVVATRRGTLDELGTKTIQSKGEFGGSLNNWFTYQDMVDGDLLDYELYTAPLDDATGDPVMAEMSFNVMARIDQFGFNYKNGMDLYFGLRENEEGGGTTRLTGLLGSTNLAACSGGVLSEPGGSKLVLTYDIVDNNPLPIATSTPTPTATLPPLFLARDVFVASRTYFSSNGSAAISPPAAGFRSSVSKANEIYAYKALVELDNDQDSFGQPAWLGAGTHIDYVVMRVEAALSEDSIDPPVPFMLLTTNVDPQSDFHANLLDAAVLYRGTIDQRGGQVFEIDVTDAWPETLVDADFGEQIFLTLMPDTFGFDNQSRFQITLVSITVYYNSNAPSSTPSETPTNTLAPTITPTDTATDTPFPTRTPLATNTPALSFTPSKTATRTNTPLASLTPTKSPSPTVTETPTLGPTPVFGTVLNAIPGTNVPRFGPAQIVTLYITNALIGPNVTWIIIPTLVSMEFIPGKSIARSDWLSSTGNTPQIAVRSSVSGDALRLRFDPAGQHLKNDDAFATFSTVGLNLNDALGLNKTGSTYNLGWLDGGVQDSYTLFDSATNRVIFGVNQAYLDVDDGAFLSKGRATFGSSNSTLNSFVPIGTLFPKTSAGAPIGLFSLSAEHQFATASATTEIGFPCPLLGDGTRLKELIVYSFFNNANDRVGVGVFATDAAMVQSDILSFALYSTNDFVTHSGSQKKKTFTLNHTISGEKVWARLTIYTTTAGTTTISNTEWVFEEIKK